MPKLPVKKPKDTKESLKQKIMHLEAQLASTYFFADASLEKAGQKYFMASGVVLQLTALNGKEIIIPVMIKNGLSDETIAAIRADLARSFIEATGFVPSGARKKQEERSDAPTLTL